MSIIIGINRIIGVIIKMAKSLEFNQMVKDIMLMVDTMDNDEIRQLIEILDNEIN
jgi:hypothetical protein